MTASVTACRWSQEGLVGRVDAVTAKAARVRLITDPNMVVNVLESLNEAQLTGSLTGISSRYGFAGCAAKNGEWC